RQRPIFQVRFADAERCVGLCVQIERQPSLPERADVRTNLQIAAQQMQPVVTSAIAQLALAAVLKRRQRSAVDEAELEAGVELDFRAGAAGGEQQTGERPDQ